MWESFGEFARAIRLAGGYGLRQAAREMGISAAYLSRVEKDVDPPSADLIFRMSRLYRRPIEDFNAAARKPAVSAEVRGREIQSREDLRVLYRLGLHELFNRDELEEIIRSLLKKRGLGDDEVERELARLRAELPRIRQSQREGLLATDIKPRFLTKRNIAALATRLLESNGLGHSTYAPPTPIERLIENQDGISYRIAELPSKNGAPIVMGLSRWSDLNEREIVINSALADSRSITSEHRFNFTLAHELFHVIEHLPLVRRAGGSSLMRLVVGAFVECGTPPPRQSAAKKAVESWTRTAQSGALLTNEDWREWQANTFASNILMPEWAVADEFRKRSRADFIDVPAGVNVREEALGVAGTLVFDNRFYDKTLSELFSVSRQAMAIRLLDLGFVREVTG